MSPAMVDFRSPLQKPNPSSNAQTPSSFISRRDFNPSQGNMPSSTDGTSSNFGFGSNTDRFGIEGGCRPHDGCFASPLPSLTPSMTRPRLVKPRRLAGSSRGKPTTPASAGRIDPGFNPFRSDAGRMRDEVSRFDSSINPFQSSVSVSDGSDGADEGKMRASDAGSGFNLIRPRAPVTDGLEQVEDGKNQPDFGFNSFWMSGSVLDNSGRIDGVRVSGTENQVNSSLNLFRPKAPVSDGSSRNNDGRMQATERWVESGLNPFQIRPSVSGGPSEGLVASNFSPFQPKAPVTESWVESGIKPFHPSTSASTGADLTNDGRMGGTESRVDSGFCMTQPSTTGSSHLDRADDRSQAPPEQVYGRNPFSSQEIKGKDVSEGWKSENFNSSKSAGSGFIFGANLSTGPVSDSDLKNMLPDEMRKLKIGAETTSNVNTSGFTFTTGPKGSSSLSSGLNLNSGEVRGEGVFVFGSSGKKNTETNSLVDNKVSELPDEMRKLNIEKKAKDSNLCIKMDEHIGFVLGSNKNDADSFSTSAQIPDKLNVGKGNADGTDIDHSSSTTSVKDKNKALGLSDEVRKLKSEEIAKGANRMSKKDEKTNFVFGSSKNVAGSFGMSGLSDEVRKLKIEETAKDPNLSYKMDEKTGFDFESCKNVAGSFRVSGLLDEVRKLKIEDMAGDANLRFKADEKTGFVFGSSTNVAGSFKASGLSDEVRKMKIEETARDAYLSSKTDDRTGFVFGSSKNAAGSLRLSSLSDEVRKLKINESANDPNLSSKMDENMGFVFGSSKDFAGSAAGSILPDEVNELNAGRRFGDKIGREDIGYFPSTNSAKDSQFEKLSKGNEKIRFAFGSTNVAGSFGESILPDEMRKLISRTGDDSGQEDMDQFSTATSVKDAGFGNLGGGFSSESTRGTTILKPFTFLSRIQGSSLSMSQNPSVRGSSSLSSTESIPQAAERIFDHPNPDRVEHKPAFCFMGKKEGLETPRGDPKMVNHLSSFSSTDNLFSAVSQKLEFSAKPGAVKNVRLKKKRDRVRPCQQQHGNQFISSQKISQENSELGSPGSYSPMDFSPYQEEVSTADQCSRETSLASDHSLPLATNLESTEANQSVPVDAKDEDLLASTQCLNSNECGLKCRELNGEGLAHLVEESIGSDYLISKNSKTANNNDINLERQADDGGNIFCFSSHAKNFDKTNFTFSAPPSAQGPLSAVKRNYRKKNRLKVAPDSFSFPPNAKTGLASPSPQFFPLAGTSLQAGPCQGQKGESAVSQNQADKEPEVRLESTPNAAASQNQADKEPEVRLESAPNAAATAAAQEACEKWRLRGNQAYASGNLSKAEDYYTRGVNCISSKEASRGCVRALMLCYSNRAATRMSMGRMREALADCMVAASIDPGFLRVQARAANCYLALGEIKNALKHFKKCLQPGNDVVFDQKIRIEASDGLQKAQQVAEYMDRSTELLRQRTFNDAANALQIITEALSISTYCDCLFEMKAEALLMLRKYEEVVQLCEQTLDSAERNSTVNSDDGVLETMDGFKNVKNSSSSLWRWRLLSKSYFYMGKLEEALDVLQKHEEVGPIVEKYGSKMPESSSSFAATVRELLRYKAAGNEAFQAGRHSEAVEHYTAAIGCNVDSRPFAAICFCNRAAAYQALGQITDAIADCSLAIALASKYAKAISRRATLHEMIRDYGQASNDLSRLISLLEKQSEDKGNQSGASGRSTSSVNDIRQARLRLMTMEEEAKKEIPLDMYLILGIESSCTAADIKKAYRKAALRHHPDKAGQFLARSENGDDRVWKEVTEEVHKDADRLFKMIGEAYAVLSDPVKRSWYDAEEEKRNALTKGNGSGIPRTPGDVHNSPSDKSSSRRQWREPWKSYGSPHQRWSETSRSNRYYS